MSYASDIVAEQAGLYELQLEEIARGAKGKTWTTRDGVELPVELMTVKHIRNALGWIQRNDPLDILLPWVTVFTEELKRRGEEW